MITFYAEIFGRFQQHKSSVDIGLNEAARFHQRTVYVGFGGKVDNGVYVELAHCLINCFCVANVSLIELIAQIIAHRCQIFQVSGVGQFIKDRHRHVTVGVQHKLRKISANKPGATGNKQVFHWLFFLRNCH